MKNSIKIIITVLVVLLVAIVGIETYLIANNKQISESKVTELEKEIATLKETSSSNKLESEANTTTTQTSDEKFKSYINNFKKTRSEYTIPDGSYKELSYIKTEYNPTTEMNVDLDQDGNLYLYINPSFDIANTNENNVGSKKFYEEFNKKYNKRYKVATDVIDVINFNCRQGTYGSFAYVKSDGSVYELSILAGPIDYTERKENIEINKLENLKNIISLQYIGYWGISAIAIDIDGNMHSFPSF